LDGDSWNKERACDRALTSEKILTAKVAENIAKHAKKGCSIAARLCELREPSVNFAVKSFAFSGAILHI